MFKRFMDQAKLNNCISKHRKLAKTEPESGYSAIISACLEQEAKGTFKSWPEYMKKTINSFYVEALNEFSKTEVVQNEMTRQEITEINDCTLVATAVLVQAMICKDFSHDEIISDLENVDNLFKKLVNIKLLPERYLKDEIDFRTVA